jgi:DNA-binding response OmpR family regulator
METKRIVTVLLVDDDPASRKRNEESLKDRGYLVTVASEAGLALDLAKRCSPSAIFLHLDARGSGRAGLISAFRANDNSRHVPIVFLADRSPGRAGLTPVGRDGW